MKRIVPGAAWLLAAALVGAGGTALSAAEPAREGPWIINDLPAAQAAARQSGRPLFVVFRCER